MRALCLAAALLLAWPTRAATVEAAHHDAFWLWAGVRSQPALKKARTIYLLQGEVKAHGGVRLVSQRPAIPKTPAVDMWMVVRAETLDWPPAVHARVLMQISRWRAAGNRVVGIQIDFDSATRHLDRYVVFLRDLRGRLPRDIKLGVTGLLDWSANGDPEELSALGDSVDEIVLQIYQGHHVIPGYAAYLERIDRLKIPFRIGLLQGGEWDPPLSLVTHPSFKGYVVFLRNAGK